MTKDTWHERLQRAVQVLQRFTDRLWYLPLLALLAALDNLVLVVPTDGLVISSTMLRPRRWLTLALCVSIGSTAGAMALAALVEQQGLPWILGLFPGLQQTASWEWSVGIFAQYGLVLVFLVALTPLTQQPAVILASLANVPLLKLAAVIFAGRTIKYLIMAYVASHAPRLLSRMWGLETELEEVGVKMPKAEGFDRLR